MGALRRFEHFVLRRLPDRPPVNRMVAQYKYFLDNRRFAVLDQPNRFPDWIMRLKLENEANAATLAQITDKANVKDFVAARVGPGRTPETFAVLRTQEAIERFEFPPLCVVKPTHACREVILLDERAPTGAERERMAAWLRHDHFLLNREPNYRGLQPKVIVEEFLRGPAGPPDDIKVFCFSGRPKFIQVDRGRFSQHERDFYGLDGGLLDMSFRIPSAYRPFDYCAQRSDIIETATRLSKGFPFLRVDLYAAKGTVMVGELTPYPANGTIRFSTRFG